MVKVDFIPNFGHIAASHYLTLCATGQTFVLYEMRVSKKEVRLGFHQ
ncbi:hypothetical protein GWE18_34775 [Bradyrhizobium sp. CSA112]|nr:hypothetical protein [Bradyrhizobium sp. CSA112]MDE5457890.1 hypothetical protein [Bradyrhizobium sp. CSA112]